MHDIEHMFYIKSAGRFLSGTTFGGTERGDEELFYFHTLCTKMEKILFSVPLLPLVRKIERGDSGGGFAFLRKNHAGCGAPPAHRQEPAFESTFAKEKRQPLTGSPQMKSRPQGGHQTATQRSGCGLERRSKEAGG